jgi:predicted TIM-barrel fold metal-dependent hydrolase
LFLGVILTTLGCQDSREFYDKSDFASMEKVDAHVHINAVNPLLITLGLENNMRLITINTDAWEDFTVVDQENAALELIADHPGQLAYIASFSMDGWENHEKWQEKTIEHLAAALENGASGVKVWKNIGLVLKDTQGNFLMIDDPVLDPVFDYIAKQGVPLYGHIGEPKNTWLPLEEMTVAQDYNYFADHPQYHMYQHPEFPSYDQIIEARNNMLDKNPELVFVGCHLGSMEWSIQMMSEHLDRYPNMIYDMAHRVPHLQYIAQKDRDKVRDFFIRYQDRLVYSTDLQQYEDSDPEEFATLVRNTWMEDWEFFVTDNEMDNFQFEGSFTGLKLPITVIDKIYLENIRKWVPLAGF